MPDRPGESGLTPALRFQTLGGFRAWRGGQEIPRTAWGREKALHLIQFLVTARKQPLHKEGIIDRLWPELDLETGDRDFKVALHAIQNALEPERKPRAPSRYIRRTGLAYGLDLSLVSLDADQFEREITLGNQLLLADADRASSHYQSAVELYSGPYLPERQYEDWTSLERERLMTLALVTMSKLADLQVPRNPYESLRLTQQVLSLEPAWEDAYRTQIRAYLETGNRPMAIRTYQQCEQVLMDEYGLEPLPETQALMAEIQGGM